MLLNEKLNDKAQIILQKEAVHTCEHVRNGMATTGSTTSSFGNFYGENQRLLVSSKGFVILATSLNGTSSRRKW